MTWLAIYFGGFISAAFARGLLVRKPERSLDHLDWQMANALLPVIWPLYLPGLLCWHFGNYCRRKFGSVS